MSEEDITAELYFQAVIRCKQIITRRHKQTTSRSERVNFVVKNADIRW